METPVNFRTNIDCCKIFMQQNSGLPLSKINPSIGDLIRVYHSSDFEIEMKVIDRRWKLTNGSNPELNIYLAFPNGFDKITEFEKILKNRGFPV